MITTSPPTVIGIFKDPAHAAAAVRALREAGFAPEDIGLAAREWQEPFREVRLDLQEASESGAKTGALTGGALGVAAGIAGAALLPLGAPIFLGVLGPVLAGAAVGSAP
jgi:hypothetical protein